MKVKFYLLVSAFALAALAFAGCSDNNDSPSPDELTYTLNISGISINDVVVSVTPSSNTERYWVDVIEKAQYDSECSSTPDGLKSYLPTLLAARAQAAGKTISELIAADGKVGSTVKNFLNLKAETDYIAFAIAVSNNGVGASAAKVEPFKTLGVPAAYVLTVTDVTVSTAKLNAVPQNKEEVYWLDFIEKDAYINLGGTPESFAEYVPELLAALADYLGGSIADVLGLIGSVGDEVYEAEELDPATDYIAYAVGVNQQGELTNVAVVTPFTTLTPSGTAPVVTLSMTPGDKDGAEPQTNMLVGAKSSDVASFKYGLFDNAQVLALIETGKTYEYIADSYGEAATADEITAINSAAGWATTFIELDPGAEYCLIVKATATGGLSTTQHMAKSTEPAGEATDAYKAWLGTWTVTSTSSVVNKAPVSFDLVISQKISNTTYSATGWGITALRNVAAAAISLKFNSNGTFSILNEQTFGREEEAPAGMNAFCFAVPVSGGYAVVTGTGLVGLTATLSGDKQSATIAGEVNNIQGNDYTTAYMDYFFLGDDDKIYSYQPAPGCTSGDYAMAPFTMTKKSAAPAAAPYKDIMPKAFTLSPEGRLATFTSESAAVVSKNARVSKIDKPEATNKASIRQMIRRK